MAVAVGVFFVAVALQATLSLAQHDSTKSEAYLAIRRGGQKARGRQAPVTSGTPEITV